MSNVKSLIDAISTGNALETEGSFNAAMAEKISSRLETMRAEVAQNMFKTPEAVVDALVNNGQNVPVAAVTIFTFWEVVEVPVTLPVRVP